MSDYPLNLIKVGLVKKLMPKSFVVWATKLTMAKVVQYVPKRIILVKEYRSQCSALFRKDRPAAEEHFIPMWLRYGCFVVCVSVCVKGTWLFLLPLFFLVKIKEIWRTKYLRRWLSPYHILLSYLVRPTDDSQFVMSHYAWRIFLWTSSNHRLVSAFESFSFYRQGQAFKSDGQEKSTKILISWQELKNQFLSFFVHR